MPMDFKCYIVGDESLVIQCGELLIENGHQIVGITTSHPEVISWAHALNISCSSSFTDLESKEFDYLFSIANFYIIPSKYLNKAKRLSINYHDALLPKYAGVHATSWAILQNEKIHGISWHIMNEQIDAGEILVQASITICKDETTLSLNLKCFEAALKTFRELISHLTYDTLIKTPQSLEERSYFSMLKKPPDNGLINWQHSAEDIDRLIRALTFGHYPNRLSSPKFILHNSVFIIDKLHISNHPSTQPAGTIVSFENNKLEIATSTTNVVIHKLKTLNRRKISVTHLVKAFHLTVGETLLIPDSSSSKKFEEISQQLQKHEAFWLNKLIEWEQTTLPFADSIAHDYANELPLVEMGSYTLRDLCLFSIADKFSASLEETFLAVFFIYLHRITHQNTLNIYFTTENLLEYASELSLLLSTEIPFSIAAKDEAKFLDVLNAVQHEWQTNNAHNTFIKDIYARYPKITKQKFVNTITVIFCNNALPSDKLKQISHSKIILCVNLSTGKITSYYRKQIFNDYLYAILQEMPEHLLALASSIMQTAKQEINFLPLLSERQHHKVISVWNQTTITSEQNKTIAQLFEEHAATDPTKVAITYKKQHITYGELNEKANALGQMLIEKGLKTQDVVIVCFERSIEFIIALLAVLKAGATYLPLDPHTPLSRFEYIPKDSGASFVITTQKIKTLLTKADIHYLNFITEIPAVGSSNNLGRDTKNSAAYIMYTSGSTGTAKGVIINQEGVIRLVKDAHFVTIKKSDHIAFTSNVAFDTSKFEIWGALLNGASLIIFDKYQLLDIPLFSKALIKHQVTILWLTSSLFNQMINQEAHLFATVETLIIGGEALNVHAITKLLHSRRPKHILNGYGPTENATFTTFYEIGEEKILAAINSVPIGKPISGTQVYVLDKYLQPTAIGSTGELYIGGIGLAQGYVNNSKLTNEKFIANPFAVPGNLKLYKSGDLARWLPDGNVDYIGRMDNQIKLRGFRIELNEIESVLEQHANISQAIVIPSKQLTGHNSLIAFLRLSKELNDAQLEMYLKDHLPEYMIPSRFIRLKNFPLNANGKIDTDKLQQLTKEPSLQEKFITLAKTTEQKILAKVWKQVLRRQRISIADNFFSLGGDSIIAIQIVSELARQGLQLSIKDLFENPTIRQLAPLLNRGKKRVKSVSTKGIIPLSPIQSWFFEQQFSDIGNWHQVCTFIIQEKIRPQQLEEALNKIIKHYDIFHFYFKKVSGVWKQYLSRKSRPLSIQTISNGELPNFTFDLSQPPLIKVFLDEREKPRKLLIAAHHLIIDGVSWRILLKELEYVYAEIGKKSEHFFVEQATSYKSWTKFLEQYASTPILQADYIYWSNICKHSFQIPVDLNHGDNTEAAASQIAMSLNSSETETLLIDTTQKYQAKVIELLLTALARVLAQWTGKETMLFHLEKHGRESIADSIDLSKTVGWFTALFPFLLLLPKNTTIENQVDITKKLYRDIPREGTSYGILRYLSSDTNIRNDLVPTTKPEICFNYWGRFDQFFTKKLFSFNSLRLSSGSNNIRPHLLDIEVLIYNECMHIIWTYSNNLHKRDTIDELAQLFIQELKLIMSEPKSSNPILSDTVDRFYPLNAIQKGMVFQDQISPYSCAYHVQLQWNINADLNINLFKSAFEMLIDKYDVLRGYINYDANAELQMFIAKNVALPWLYFDWSKFTEAQKQQHLAVWVKSDRERKFNLESPPLLRVTVIKLKATRYKIIFTFHHLLLDGWSLPILMNQLQEFYFNPKDHFAVANEYSFVSYDKKFLVSSFTANNKATIDFWRDQLKGLDKTNMSPFRPKTNTIFSFDDISLQLSFNVSNKLKEFCKKKKITLSAFFQTMWALILHFYEQNNDIVFGLTISYRPLSNKPLQHLLGMFINTLPIRAKVDASLSLLSFLMEMQQLSAEVIHHSNLPLSEIVSVSEHQSANDLFETLFIFENYPVHPTTKQNKLFNFHDIKIWDPPHYPAALEIFPFNQIAIKLTYNIDAFSKAFAKSVLKRLEKIITYTIANPRAKISSIDLILPEEKSHLLKFSGKAQTTHTSQSFFELFAHNLNSQPHATAIVSNEISLTYQALNEKVLSVAEYLVRNGLEKNQFVIVALARGANMITAILGTMRAGGAYIPFDLNYPAERLQYIIEDADPRFILTSSDQYEHLCKNIPLCLHPKIIIIDDISVKQDQRATLPKIDAQDCAYLLYTSGTTGVPKGVLVKHISIVNVLLSFKKQLSLTKKDTLLALTPLTFDISVLELLLPLIIGGKCIIAHENANNDSALLDELISKHNVTIVQGTPSFWKIHEDAHWLSTNKLHILCGGEAIDNNLIYKLLKHQSFLWNLYGPTETTIWSTLYKYKQNDSPNEFSIIGKPLSNTKVYVLDNQRKLLPVGIAGELYIAGVGVAKGYLNNTSLTREKFLANPYGTKKFPVMYKTGDIVRWREDHTLEYLGRSDNQIKWRGFRIEPAEIESAILRYPGIESCVVLLDTTSHQHLLAYMVAEINHSINHDTLKAFLREQLPRHMVPTVYFTLEEFPINQHGKIDRKKLASMFNQYQLNTEESIRAPHNTIEETLVKIWKDVLMVDNVNISQSFFDLGGHSLSALQAITKIQRVFTTEISLRDFIAHPTIAELALLLEPVNGTESTYSHHLILWRDISIVSPVLALQKKGTKDPLFFIHPVGGTIFWFMHLAKHMGEDRPIYAIQDPGIESNDLLFTNIKEVAEFYIKSIQEILPNGPYLLAGASYGATVAVEMAKQLIEKGHSVNFVGILDGWAKYPPQLLNKDLFRELMTKQHKKLHQEFKARKLNRADQWFNLQWHRQKMMFEYHLEALPFPLTLFKSNELMPVFLNHDDSTNFWQNYTTFPVKVIKVRGTHETMFSAINAKILAMQINESLESSGETTQQLRSAHQPTVIVI